MPNNVIVKLLINQATKTTPSFQEVKGNAEQLGCFYKDKKYKDDHLPQGRTGSETDHTPSGMTTDISVARGECVRGPV